MEKINRPGKVIVMEGAGDGLGKSTQIGVLENHLSEDGYSLVKHHFPTYESYQGELVKRYLSGEYSSISKELSPYFINSLYAVDRAVTWQIKLKSQYEQGKVLLLDRYTTSSLIYQATLIEDIEERKRFIEWVIDYEYNKLGIKEPDGVIFLFAPFDVVEDLLNKRHREQGVAGDIHEKDIQFLKKVHETSMFIADYLSWAKVQCNEEHRMRPVESIHEEVYSHVIKMIGHK